MPLPRPATEARSGSLEPGRPSWTRSATTRHQVPDAAAQLQPIPHACGAQRSLLPIAVGDMNINELMNINDVCESPTIFPHPCKLTFDLQYGVRVTCDVVYLRANFGLPRPLCSRVIPDVRDRQTDRQTDRRRQTKASLNAPPIRGGGIITLIVWRYVTSTKT